MTIRDFSVYSVWIVGEPKSTYAKVKTLEGVMAIGRAVEIQRTGERTWHRGRISPGPADGASLGGGTFWIELA